MERVSQATLRAPLVTVIHVPKALQKLNNFVRARMYPCASHACVDFRTLEHYCYLRCCLHWTVDSSSGEVAQAGIYKQIQVVQLAGSPVLLLSIPVHTRYD